MNRFRFESNELVLRRSVCVWHSFDGVPVLRDVHDWNTCGINCNEYLEIMSCALSQGSNHLDCDHAKKKFPGNYL